MKKKSILSFGILLLLLNLVSLPAFANEQMLDNQLRFQGLLDDGAEEDAPEINETEPNDDFNQATEISSFVSVNGNLSNTDTDIYKMTIAEKGYFVVMGELLDQWSNHEPNIGITVYKALANGSKEEITPDYNENDDEGSFIYSSLMLEPGDYFIKFTDESQMLQGEPYTFFAIFIEPDVQRISGQNRFETAVEVAYQGWLSADEIILATGRNFPDALAAAPLAYHRDAPILLTEKDALPESVIGAINELDVKKVTIIGGTGAVSKSVEDYLKNNLNLTVERIAGSNRYATSVEIAKRLPASDTAFVVYGQNYPDALSVGSYAAYEGFPILLTDASSLAIETKQQIANYDNTFVIGGKSAVSDAVMNQLPNPKRISGINRYDTSVKIAEEFFTPQMNYATISTGANFADALTGSVLAAINLEPIILTPSDTLHDGAKRLFTEQNTLWYTIIGGKSAVSQNIENELWELTK